MRLPSPPCVRQTIRADTTAERLSQIFACRGAIVSHDHGTAAPSDEQQQRSFAFGPFLLVPGRQLLLKDGVAVRIGGRALDLLTVLVERPGELVSKRDIVTRVWPDVTVVDDNLKVNLGALRRVLGEDAAKPVYIATIPGRGYRFVASVQSTTAGGEPRSPPVTSGRNNNLPAATTRVFGRTSLVDTVRSDLTASRLVSVVGPGGMGKTTVALAAAEAAMDLYRDGVWIVELAPVRDPALLPNAIAATLGVTANSPDTVAGLCQGLMSRELLIVLDSCEHIIEAAAHCADRILVACAGIRILVTSREPLRVRGERIRRLLGLGVPAFSSGLTAAEAMTYPAVELFVDRATDRLEDFALTDTDAPMVADICRRLDGLALAIELAAARVDDFGVAGIHKQLDDRFRLLAGRRAGPERHRTLAATLDWSYGLLSEEQATVLQALSVFAGVFQVDGASAVANLPSTEAAEVLSQLAAKSLISSEIRGDGIAYRLLESTRAFALERLGSSIGNNSVRRRHAAYVSAVLERAGPELSIRPANEWRASYGYILDDVRSALAWPGEDIADRASLIRLTVDAMPVWNHFSLVEECVDRTSRAVSELPAAGLAGTAVEMRLQLVLANAIMFSRGPVRSAYEAVKRGCDIADRLGEASFQLSARQVISGYEVFTGNSPAAIRTLEAFYALAMEKDPSLAHWGQSLWALAELYVGRFEPALQRVRQLFQPSLAGPDDQVTDLYLYGANTGLGTVLVKLQWLMGSPDAAAHTTALVLGQVLQAGSELSQCNFLAAAACPVALWSGRYEDATRYVDMLDDRIARNGIETWRPFVLYMRSALASEQGDVSNDTIAALRSALKDFVGMNQMVRFPHYVGTLAAALAKAGRLNEADETIATALRHATAQSELWCVPELLRIRASVLNAEHRTDEAEIELVEAMRLAEELGALSWQLRAASDLARLRYTQSRPEEARAVLLPVFSQFTEGFETLDLRVAANLLSSR
jgi:predicted ATPase/DNA-binding winged helix-turn-helix (wHTH) protein